MTKKNKPFFSIIIPTLNEEKYLPVLLNDLSNQTFQDFELFIVDAQSTDSTIKKANSFKSINPTILTSDQKNVGHQRNLGAQKSTADWLIFFDADNQLPPYFLEGIKYKISRHPADSYTTHIKPDSDNPQDSTVAKAANIGLSLAQIANKPMVFGAIIVIKKQVFNQLNGFDNSKHIREDVDLIDRIIKNKFKFKVLDDPKITCSFRRLRTEGTLKVARKIAKLELNQLINYPKIDQSIDYPMQGGAFYQSSPHSNSLITSFQHIRKSIKQTTESKKQQIQTIIRSILEEPN